VAVYEPSVFQFSRTLACGTFGRVKHATHDGMHLAIKVMKKYNLIKLKQADHVIQEKRLLAQADSPFIVYMSGYAKDEHYIYIVMECVPGGELFTHLRQMRKFKNEQAKFYAAQAGHAIKHIHGKNIIHRDVKPENILLTHQGYCKITDFGFAKLMDPGTRTYTLCGTPEYMSPEVLVNKGHSKPVDWWALGILAYEMMVGQPPFCDDDPMGLYQKVLSCKVYFPKFFDKDAKVLVKKLLVADLSKRWGNLRDGPDQVIGHPWFNGLDVPKLLRCELPAPYKPRMRDEWDLSNFEEEFPDSHEQPKPVTMNDPFADWCH